MTKPAYHWKAALDASQHWYEAHQRPEAKQTILAYRSFDGQRSMAIRRLTLAHEQPRYRLVIPLLDGDALAEKPYAQWTPEEKAQVYPLDNVSEEEVTAYLIAQHISLDGWYPGP